MEPGESVTIKSTVKPDNATDKTVYWSSSNATIATVENGKVTALAEGETTVIAKAGGKEAKCTVTVKKSVVAVESISLDNTSLALEPGQEETLKVTVKPDNATDKTVSWSTSNAEIATVEDGKVIAVSEGEAMITAKAGGKEAKCKVTVKKTVIKVTSITLSASTLELVKGQETTLTATVLPEDATDKTVVFSSSQEDIVSVEQNGRVFALKSGTAVITAKASEEIATCEVSITTPVERVTLDRYTAEMIVGESISIVAVIYPDDADTKTVLWRSTDTTIATVEDGVVTALSPGTATITAVADDKEASCLITVTQKDVGVLTVSETSFYFNYPGGEDSFNVDFRGRWKIISDASWCHISPDEGESDVVSIRITVDESDGSVDRTATLTVVSLDDDQQVQVTVQQYSKAASADWRNRKFSHRSLLLSNTSVWCPYTTILEQDYLAHIPDEVQSKYIKVSVYGNFMGEDPLAVDGVDRMETFLNFSGYPTSLFDFRVYVNMTGIVSAFIENVSSAIHQQEQLYPSATGHRFSSSLSGRTLTVVGSICSHEAEDFKLLVYLVEKEVEYDGIHKDVMRASFTDILGDTISIQEKNTTKDYNYSIELPDGCNPTNCYIVVSTLRKYGTQAFEGTYNYGRYVDNCAQARVGESHDLELEGFLSDEGTEGIVPGEEITF